MKFFAIVFTFSFFNFCFSQAKKTDISNVDIVTDYKPVGIEIFKNNMYFTSANSRYGTKYVFYNNLDSGFYKIVISKLGKPVETKENIFIKKGQTMVVNFTTNGICLYDHPANYLPICPQNHNDRIIPIRYGLMPNLRNKKQSKKEEEYYSGGCEVSDCDPNYYCKIHKIEF